MVGWHLHFPDTWFQAEWLEAAAISVPHGIAQADPLMVEWIIATEMDRTPVSWKPLMA